MLTVKFLLYAPPKVLKPVYDMEKRYPSSASHYAINRAGRLNASHGCKVLGT